MAAALGAEVAPAGRVEIGYAPLTLTADGLASPLRAVQSVPVLHWHGDQFGIPAGARRLAETPGFPNQAFSLGPRILGLQFHLEADASRIEQWLIGHACELSRHGIDPAAIRRDAERHGPSLARSAGLAIGIWLDAL
jgi:GMP synthase (glutamine-hydrolysing)